MLLNCYLAPLPRAINDAYEELARMFEHVTLRRTALAACRGAPVDSALGIA